ncbi:MAG: energy-coupled thiamine transporter ThiT [Bacilli bacterium]|nr:energy-coupled thiamine transporter ThiT [Bacilli bacterium]
MDESVSEKKELKFRFDLLALFLLVVGIGCSFIGPFYQIVGTGITDYRLGNLLASGVLGVGGNVFLILVVLVIPALAILASFSSKWFSKANLISFIVLFTDAVLSCLVPFILGKMIGSELKIEETYFCSKLPTIIMFVASAVMLISEQQKESFNVRDITETGVLIAAAIGLNFLKLFSMPTGGSVNLQMLPLFLLALRRGPLKGFIGAGIVYGLISVLIDGYSLPCYPFDYLLGFGSVLVLGLFQPFIFGKDQVNYNLKGEIFLLIGCILATTVRFIGGCVSSVLLWDTDVVGAMAYNVGYVYVSGGIAMAIIMALYGPLAMINNRFPPNGKEELPE